MLSFKDRSLCFDYQRCCQCGTCLAACIKEALISNSQLDGTSRIVWNRDNCIFCGRCADVCPAIDLPEKLLTERTWQFCKAMWLGHATNSEVRYAASSGGVARTLVHNSLAAGFCDSAYCVVKQTEYPWAGGTYLQQGDNIFKSLANSMYLPIPVNLNLKDDFPGKVLLIVGTNCQLLAAEKFYRRSRTKLIKIGILCKQQKNLLFSNFMCRRLNVAEETPLQYRGDGWPGLVSAERASLFWEDAAGIPFGKRLWRIPGCRFCGNPLGANADLTLADPWGILSQKTANGGRSIILVHTEAGRELLDSCADLLVLDHLDIGNVKQSVDWPGIKKQQLKIRWRLGLPTKVLKRFVYSLGDLQCRFYEWLFMRFTPSRLFLKIINRIPYLG